MKCFPRCFLCNFLVSIYLFNLLIFFFQLQTDPKMNVVPAKNQHNKRKMSDETEPLEESPNKTAKNCESAAASLSETRTRRGISGNVSNSSQKIGSSESESAFKQPLVPKIVLKQAPKPRKLFHQEECTIDPVILMNAQAMNELPTSKGTKSVGNSALVENHVNPFKQRTNRLNHSIAAMNTIGAKGASKANGGMSTRSATEVHNGTVTQSTNGVNTEITTQNATDVNSGIKTRSATDVNSGNANKNPTTSKSANSSGVENIDFINTTATLDASTDKHPVSAPMLASVSVPIPVTDQAPAPMSVPMRASVLVPMIASVPSPMSTSVPSPMPVSVSSSMPSIEPIEFDQVPKTEEELPILPKSAHTLTLCQAIVEKNARKLNECIRSSLSEALCSFLDEANPDGRIQMAEDALKQQQLEYDAMINRLREQNNELKTKLKSMQIEHEEVHAQNTRTVNQNQDLTVRVRLFHGQSIQLAADLKEANAKIAQITNGLSEKNMTNANLNVKQAQIEAMNRELNNRLQNSEAKNAQLASENKRLEEINQQLNKSLDELSLKNQTMIDQMTAESKQMTADAKKKQWCVTCDKQGGRYYCSSQCEEIYWYVLLLFYILIFSVALSFFFWYFQETK